MLLIVHHPVGHALNKILKDFINRYAMLRGRRVHFIPGWDCHGLPIELKVLQGLSATQRQVLTPLTLRAAAAEFASATVEAQKTAFQRYGCWADWDAPYMTLQRSYEAAQLGVFGAMFLNGHIYRGKKPVHWSPSSRTALAEAELEYPEGHVSRSVYCAMPLVGLSPAATADAALGEALTGSRLSVWTTTPWTLPGNAAVAVNAALSYSVVTVGAAAGDSAAASPGLAAGTRLVVATDLVPTLAAKLKVALTVHSSFPGAALEGATYSHPLAALGGEYAGRVSPVVVGGDYITTEAGTGLVHTAPGHGQEDYLTGMKAGLPMLSPVDDAGCFTEEAGPGLQGLSVLTDGTAACIAGCVQSGSLLLEEKYPHKYPYDWRTKKPTIFRATSQWFASVERFRDDALAAIAEVTWIPAVGQKRITPMVAGRNDWCISRQRAWGVPIPVFYDAASGEPLLDGDTLAHVQALVAEKGSDCWWELGVADLLPEKHKHLAGSLVKGTDTMDVWFDSGSSWAGVLGDPGRKALGLRLPADLYLEGSDQHRGWFQSSLLTSVAATGKAPYKSVLTHGFVLDEKGQKMSKSIGNVVDPRRLIEGGPDEKKEPAYGADTLRLWVASVDYTSDVLIGPSIMKQMAETYRKLRGTLRYLLGNLHDFNPQQQAVPYAQLPAIDRFTLRRLGALSHEVKSAYDVYAFARAYAALNAFTVTFFSALYLDTAKDRLYIRHQDSPSRRACQTVLAEALRHMVAALAPLTPHLAEEAFQASPFAGGSGGSVFQAGWPAVPAEWSAAAAADEDEGLWATLLLIRAEVNKLLEVARNNKDLGAGLEARVLVHVSGDASPGDVAGLEALFGDKEHELDGTDELRYLLLVSSARVAADVAQVQALGASPGGCLVTVPLPSGTGTLTIALAKAEGTKCERCWNFSPLVGKDGHHPQLCQRCSPVIKAQGLGSWAELKEAQERNAAAAATAAV